MSDQVEKKYEPLETTKHTEDNSIIEEKLPHHANGETVSHQDTLWLILLAFFRTNTKN